MGEWNLAVSYEGNNQDEVSDYIIQFVGIIPREEFFIEGWNRYFIIFSTETEVESLRKELVISKARLMKEFKYNVATSVVHTNDLYTEDDSSEQCSVESNIVTHD